VFWQDAVSNSSYYKLLTQTPIAMTKTQIADDLLTEHYGRANQDPRPGALA